MTKPKIVALLSVLALLASLPLTVALAQGAPYLVIGEATLDDEPAMMGTMVVAMVNDHKVGEGEVFDDQGRYRLHITQGNVGDTVMISLAMGEGEEATQYMTMTEEDVMIGLSGERAIARLKAYTGEPPDPLAPTLTAPQEREAMRGPSGRQGLQGFPGIPGEPGPPGADGAPGHAGADGSTGTHGTDGVNGPAGADGAAGADGIDGTNGSDGSNGSEGLAGPAGADGRSGANGADGADGAAGGGGMIAIAALLIAIVGAAAGGGAFIAGRKSS